MERASALALVTAMSGALSGTLSACQSGDRFAAGEWEVEGWLETAGHESKADRIRQTVTLRPERAALPPASVFFGEFYHGVKNVDVRFEAGVIEGSYQQGRVDGIAAHTVRFSGTYSADSFDVSFDLGATGLPVMQRVQGRRLP